MMKNIVLMLSICLISCSKKEDRPLANGDKTVSTISEYLKLFNDKEKIDKLLSSIKNNGDTLAYNELKQIYSLSGHREDYLHISLLMANKYKYKQAYYDVYKDLNVLSKTIINGSKDSTNMISLDVETENLKKEYLKKAAMEGHLKAKHLLKSVDSIVK